MKALEMRNEQLMTEIELLKAEMRGVGVSRSSDVRQTFGDRWRAAGLGEVGALPLLQTTSGVPPETGRVEPVISAVDRPRTSSLPANSNTSPTPHVPVPPASPPQVIFRAPHIDRLTTRAAADMSAARNRALVLPSLSANGSFADLAFNALPSDQPVEATVRALRTTVMQLAAGMDHLDRRHEV